MATYNELHALAKDADLINRIAVAVAVKAQAIIDSATPTAPQLSWAKEAIEHPRSKAEALLYYVLAKHKALTNTQITQATDATLQTAVDAAADKLIGVV